ncbi:MAG: sce7726 family protein, partial [Lachnospiraceae bacterium]|nr:sce7726 family protein [Lachnospiraceae bacterium]
MTEKNKLYDRDIREPLFEFLEDRFGKVRILEEKRAGRAVADVIMITPTAIYGIEIKSDADTYTRLEKQVSYYNLYFDRNIVVVGTSHAAHIDEHVPDFWGIITVEVDQEGKTDFYVLREPSTNPEVSDKHKISLLWRPELANIQAKNDLPRYPRKSKSFVQDVLLERVSPDILWPQMYVELFERDYTTIAQRINEYRQATGQHKRKRKKYKRLK